MTDSTKQEYCFKKSCIMPKDVLMTSKLQFLSMRAKYVIFHINAIMYFI